MNKKSRDFDIRPAKHNELCHVHKIKASIVLAIVRGESILRQLRMCENCVANLVDSIQSNRRR